MTRPPRHTAARTTGREFALEALGRDSGVVENVSLIGSDETLTWTQDTAALRIAPPKKTPCEHAVVFVVGVRG